jgi:hypothetical protein
MKRFSGTEKWQKPWYRKLAPRFKCFLQFIWDNCDCAGFWDPDFELASFYVGETITEEEVLAFYSKEVRVLANGKWWIADFVKFQYGQLSPDCKAHYPVLKALKAQGIAVDKCGIPELNPNPIQTLSEGYPKAIDTLSEGFHNLPDTLQEKEKEKEKESTGSGGVGGETVPCGEDPNTWDRRVAPPQPAPTESQTKARAVARVLLGLINNEMGLHFPDTDEILKPIVDRVIEVRFDTDGLKLMVRRKMQEWKGTQYAKGITPYKLFGKEFHIFYTQREMPIILDNRASPKRANGDHRAEKLAREYPEEMTVKILKPLNPNP